MARLRRFVRVPSPSLIVAVIALLVATSGAALAAIPDADDVIHGCYTNRTGALRVIDSEAPASESCTSKETPLNWNVTGPPGEPGAAGEPGPAGTVTATYFRSATVEGGFAVANCDAGDFATGGGGGVGGGATLGSTVPTAEGPGSPPIGWLVSTPAGPQIITAYVICVDATP